MQQAIVDRKITQKSKTGFWDGQLGYAHAFISVLMAMIIGYMLHLQVGYGATMSSSVLLWVALVPLLVVAVVCRIFRQNRIVHWMTGIPFAVVVSTFAGLLALAGGFFPQTLFQEKFGAPSMWASWPFIMVIMLMMVSLVGSSAKRLTTISYINIQYLLNHIGLVLVIGGGAYGAASLERMSLVLFEGKPNHMATSLDGIEHHLPFSATLREFEMETFPPTLAVVSIDDTKETGLDVKPGSEFVEKGYYATLDGYKIEVLEYLPKALYMAGEWKAAAWETTAPAANIVVTKPDGSQETGWVSSGSIDVPGTVVPLGEEIAVVMPTPRPKKFLSKIDIKSEAGEKSIQIEVNKPVQIEGYDLYQLSYDDTMGTASQYSVIEVVKDNGISWVYAGMFLILAGTMMQLWTGVGGKK